MRISSSLYFQTGVNTINKQESDLLHLFQQIGTGRRMVTAADDPLAAAQSITLAQSQSMNKRFGDNREVALRALGESENVLGNVVGQLSAIKTRLIEAGNGALSDQDRAALAQVLAESQETLLGAMNATDAAGQYLFSGSQGKNQPFALQGDQFVYQGDAGTQAARNIQVEHTRVIDVGNHGQDIFMRTAPGTMAFIHEGTQGNNGEAVLGTMQVSDSSKASQVGHIAMQFVDNGVDGPHWQVEVFDTQGNTLTANPLEFAQAGSDKVQINLKDDFGLSFTISGQPQDGDEATYSQAKQLNGNSRLNILNTLSTAIEALNTPTKGDPAAQAQLQNALNHALQVVDVSYDNVLTVQASIGSRMNELESLNDSGSLQSLQLSKELSRLEDVDYYTATTQLSLRSMALEAASLAFTKIQSTSLFSMGK